MIHKNLVLKTLVYPKEYSVTAKWYPTIGVSCQNCGHILTFSAFRLGPRLATGSDGSGPEDPMLERRVENLENDVKDIRSTLQRFEILLVEIRANLLNVATKEDIRILTAETAEIRACMETRSELEEVRRDTSKIREELAENKGRVSGVE
eukprot:gene22438-23595_t